MAYTQADLTRLEAAIALGVTRVRDHDGSETQFRSLADMERIRDRIRAELGLIENNGVAVQFMGYSKGVK